MQDFSFDGTCLYKRIYDATEARVVGRMVVPAGGAKSLTYNGRRRTLTPRRRLLLEKHDSDAQGFHPSAEHTIAKLRESVWWPGLESDAQAWVASCHTCRITKPQKGLTPEDRHELYERPFRVLFIDAIGPISPAPEGYTHIYHCECPFTRFAWLKAETANTEELWAKFLVEDVFFDLAGFPVVLRSDRGAAFTGGVIAAINRIFSITHRLGSSYHPQAQGYIEARHKPINNIVKACCANFPETWPRVVKYAQWALRPTPRSDRQGRTPFGSVTGCKP